MVNLSQVDIGSHHYLYAERGRLFHWPYRESSVGSCLPSEYAMSQFVYSLFLVPPSGQKKHSYCWFPTEHAFKKNYSCRISEPGVFEFAECWRKETIKCCMSNASVKLLWYLVNTSGHQHIWIMTFPMNYSTLSTLKYNLKLTPLNVFRICEK